MRFEPVFYYLGRLICMIAGLMLLPAAAAYVFGEWNTLQDFLGAAFVTLAIGVFLTTLFRKSKDQPIATRDGFLLVTLAWVSISLLGAIPFYLDINFKTFIDAFFESTSGFTTTGATILSNIEAVPKSLLIWRSFSQWIGGLGIVVLAVAILPQLSVGGMQLLKNEMPGPMFEQLKPRIKQTALSLWKIYLLFSLILLLLLSLMGMPVFEGICHMFSTIGSGGFSPLNDSFAGYSDAIQMTVTLFMFLAGMNFVLHYAFLHGDFKKVFNNSEWRFYCLMLLAALVVVSASLILERHMPFWEAFHNGIFQIVSIASSTGYSTDAFGTWPFLAQGILFLLMAVGGCAGSTAGGFKQIRLQLLLVKARQTLVKQIFPQSVIPVKIGKKVVSEDVMDGVSNIFLIYMVIFCICTLALLAFNFDFRTATSAVVASMSNMGPGIGMVGPAYDYGWCPPFVKLLLSFCMITGRLEIFTVLVLFLPSAWKR